MPATQKRDYYEVLGVSKTASADEIKRAYRKVAMAHHPDRAAEGDKAKSEAIFREGAEAYEVLSDDAKRARYDQLGHAGVSSQHQDYSHAAPDDIMSMFDELFQGFGGFGGQRRGGGGQQRQARGYDLETQVELTLNEVATGTEKTIEFERAETCGKCSGSGAKPGTSPIVCPQCGGQGRVAQAGLGARSAAAEEMSFAKNVPTATARAVFRRSASSRSRFLPASKKARPSASQAKVSRAKAPRRRAICTATSS
jgi:molecular chaperone DnaJ